MFAESFFDELEKIAMGKSSYRDPEKDPEGDERHWQKRRIASAALSATPLGSIGSAIGARKGRKLRAALGAIAGGTGGLLLASRLGGGLAAQTAAGTLGGAAGSYLAHGRYNPEVAKREYKKMNA
jgi:hypothetical protein